MIEWMQLKLKNGITMVTTRDGDYHFSYFLWFEDCNVRYAHLFYLLSITRVQTAYNYIPIGTFVFSGTLSKKLPYTRSIQGPAGC